VFSVEPRCFSGTDEKLGPVGVGSGVGHRQDSGSSVPQLEILVLKLVTIDGFAAGSVVVGEITALAHEVGDHTMEGRALITETFFSGAQGTEVLGSLRDDISPQLHDNTSNR